MLNEMLEALQPMSVILAINCYHVHRMGEIHEPAVQVVGVVKISHVVSVPYPFLIASLLKKR